MNAQDRNAIDSVFSRIQEVERQGAPRDGDAERLIQERIQKQPGSAYYLAQTVLVQEQALKNAQQRIQELEKSSSTSNQASTGGAALSSTDFGRRSAPARSPENTPSASGFGRNNAGSAGGGFMAGALQTAMGVAGGMMLGNMLSGLFGGNDAQASEVPPQDEAAHDEYGQEQDYADDAGDFDDV